MLCNIDHLGKSPVVEAKRPTMAPKLPVVERVAATRALVCDIQEKAAEPLPTSSSPTYSPTHSPRNSSQEEHMVDEDEIRCPHCGELFPESVEGMLDHLDRCADEVELIGVPCECQRPYWCYGCDREMAFCQVCGRFFRMYAIWAAQQCVPVSPPSPKPAATKRKPSSPRRPPPHMVNWASGHPPATRSGRLFRGRPAPKKRARAVKKAIEDAAPPSPVVASDPIEVGHCECKSTAFGEPHCSWCLARMPVNSC